MVDYTDQCPAVAPLWGYLGVLFATVLSNMGAAYGTGKAGVGILRSGVILPELVWKNLIPIIMAGVNGIYGLICAIIILNKITKPDADGFQVYSLYTGFSHLAAGLCCGLASLASGMAIGVSGDAGVRAFTQIDYEQRFPSKTSKFDLAEPKKKGQKGGSDQIYVSMVLIQVFAGNLGLYGLITSLILTQSFYDCVNVGDDDAN
ncbi:hypothetical protein ScalyP_jg6789 [Parmales sp. scaly parma]|nr:hypothetical protein ScalyP_jg6789 [Parmales sp. scaly parma]